MNRNLVMAAAVGLALGVATLASAEPKQVKLTGDLVCGKCKLKQADKCQYVLIVEKNGQKHQAILADNEAAKKFHKQICSGEAVKVAVEGPLSLNDQGKFFVAAKSIEKVEVSAASDAPKGKVVEVTGDLVCGKCKLKQADKCQNVLIVEKNGQKHQAILADNETAKAFHKQICSGETLKVNVKGHLTKNDEGKLLINASKITKADATSTVPVSKTVELTGDLVCGKCKLKQASSCQSVLLVEKDGHKHQAILTKNDVVTKFHGNICGGGTVRVKVKGDLTKDDDGKLFIAARQIDKIDG